MMTKYYFFTVLLSLIIAFQSCEIEKPDIPKDEGNEIFMYEPCIEGIGYRFAELKTYIFKDEKQVIADHGYCWNTTGNPNIDKNFKSFGAYTDNEDGSFIHEIVDLLPGTKYYVKAYVIYNKNTIYSPQAEVTTAAAQRPVVNTYEVTNITQTTATCGGEVTDDGGSAVSKCGVCWSYYNGGMTATGDHTENGSGLGSFSFISQITGLTPGQTYFVRAYAINASGVSYGEIKEFITLSGPVVSEKKVLFYSVQDFTLSTSYEANIRDFIEADEHFTITRIVNDGDEFMAMNHPDSFAAYDLVVICESGGSAKVINYGKGGAGFPKPTLCFEAYAPGKIQWFGASYVNSTKGELTDADKAGRLIVKNASHPVMAQLGASNEDIIQWTTGKNDDDDIVKEAHVIHIAMDTLNPVDPNITNNSTLLASNLCLAEDYGIPNNGFLWALEANSTCNNRMVIWGFNYAFLQYTTTAFYDIVRGSMYWLTE